MILTIPLKYLPGICVLKDIIEPRSFENEEVQVAIKYHQSREEAVKGMETFRTKMKAFPESLIFSLGLPTLGWLDASE